MEAGTLWRIYSMTKPVTSVAAMMLYEEGALELTDPVSRFIPSFAGLRVYAGGSDLRQVTTPATEPVRIWHLLTHTAGPQLRVSPSASGGRHVPGRRVRMGDAARRGSRASL